MNSIFVDLRDCSSVIRDEFKGMDIASIEAVLTKYENALFEISRLEEKIQDMEQDIESNYKPVSVASQVE